LISKEAYIAWRTNCYSVVKRFNVFSAQELLEYGIWKEFSYRIEDNGLQIGKAISNLFLAKNIKYIFQELLFLLNFS
jgi:hypothetical protein